MVLGPTDPEQGRESPRGILGSGSALYLTPSVTWRASVSLPVQRSISLDGSAWDGPARINCPKALLRKEGGGDEEGVKG